jgi:hypothetical protein
MLNVVRAIAASPIIALAALGASFLSAPAAAMPLAGKSAGIDLAVETGSLYQTAGVRHERHRHYRHRHYPRITLGINPRRCHSPEWNHLYRHHGLWHQPRHHYTSDGEHFYDDPFWDFEPWWCDDPQVIKPRFSYKRHRHHQWASRLSAKRHFAWCQARYVSYDLRFNTFVGQSGRRYQCNSPYDFR